MTWKWLCNGMNRYLWVIPVEFPELSKNLDKDRVDGEKADFDRGGGRIGQRWAREGWTEVG